MNIVLLEPEIHFNTGNVGRTCVAAGAALHLVGKLGFSLSERQIRRSGLDYWPKLKLFRHEDFEAFAASLPPKACLLAFSAQGKKTIWDAEFHGDSYLIFGGESKGLADRLIKRFDRKLYRIPMGPDIRSLNLSTAVGIVLYEALRRTSSR